ncbi:MAG: hypothetical protein PHP45_10980 [Elusimicrobiales bacterium]|nr:hypothetical protein [Elusimicrobiales bacterium]
MKKVFTGLLAVSLFGGISFAIGFNPDVDKEIGGEPFGSAVITDTGKGGQYGDSAVRLPASYAKSSWKLGSSPKNFRRSLKAKVPGLGASKTNAAKDGNSRPMSSRLKGGLASGAIGAGVGAVLGGGLHGAAAGFAVGFAVGFSLPAYHPAGPPAL